MNRTIVDVVVIGAGAMGAMALWHLGRRNRTNAPSEKLRVLGIEQFGPAHTKGASTGESRLFRVAAKEGAVFTDAAKEARSQFLELGRIAGRDILVPAGALHLAPRDHPDLLKTLDIAQTGGVPHRILTPDDITRQYPQFTVHDDDLGVLDELGGGIRPESAILCASQAAQQAGVDLWYNTRVLSIDSTAQGVILETDRGEVAATRAIITAGPWARELSPSLAELLRVKFFTLTWFMPGGIPSTAGQFLPGPFPGFMRELDGVHAFGAPSIDGFSVKICPEVEYEPALTVEEMPTPTREELLWAGQQAQAMFPTLSPEPARWSIHPESATANKMPIIDFIDDAVVVVAGLSGNGFKFAPVWGQAAMELAVDGHSAWQQPEFTLAAHPQWDHPAS